MPQGSNVADLPPGAGLRELLGVFVDGREEALLEVGHGGDTSGNTCKAAHVLSKGVSSGTQLIAQTA